MKFLKYKYRREYGGRDWEYRIISSAEEWRPARAILDDLAQGRGYPRCVWEEGSGYVDLPPREWLEKKITNLLEEAEWREQLALDLQKLLEKPTETTIHIPV